MSENIKSKNRLFISTNANGILDLMAINNLTDDDEIFNSTENLFSGFADFSRWAQNNISYYDDATKTFVNGYNADATLFLISDTLTNLPNDITINKETDYLVYHKGATAGSGTKQAIIDSFAETQVASSHHLQDNPLDEAFKIIIDDNIADKAEAIIKKVFDDTNIRTEGLKLLTSYLKEKPKGECPPVFKGMETIYNALRNCTDNVKGDEYTQCLIQLRDEFVKHYYSI